MSRSGVESPIRGADQLPHPGYTATMSTGDRSRHAASEGQLPALPAGAFNAAASDSKNELAQQWRSFGRAATLVGLVTAPAVFLVYHFSLGWGLGWSALATLLSVAAFRGMVDLWTRRFIPWPSLFGEESAEAKEADLVARRRLHAWRRVSFWTVFIGGFGGGITTIVWLIMRSTAAAGETVTWFDPVTRMVGGLAEIGGFALILPLLFLVNFLILFGPMVYMGISQIQAYEPGESDWGVKLDDVRGQAEAKEDVRRIVTLWQSGEEFERAGGKRERGLMMLGAPGTGKTMMSKAIATNFNAPFVSIPGSGFAQTFIGLDVIIVRYLAWRAKRLARKWGGQCLVFIDEIDAVGMRRDALGGGEGFQRPVNPSYEELFFYGRMGAINPSEDLVLETRQWREQLFAARHAPAARPLSGLGQRYVSILTAAMPGFSGGGQLALNQLLVVMDGIGEPPFWRRFWTGRVNTLLDMLYVVPMRARAPTTPASTQTTFRTDLLHWRYQCANRRARPGAHAARTHGAPHLVSHADEAGSARRLQPLPRQGRTRGRARSPAPAGGASPHNERLLPRNGRADLLDGAHVRPLQRSGTIRLAGHPRRDDHD